MKPLRPAAKLSIVSLGVIAAFAVAFVAVVVREHLTDSPEAQASSGMYAAGDAMLGIAVFSLLAVAPMALALCWLRDVAWFWVALAWSALIFALTGVGALGLNIAATQPPDGWMFLLSILRIGIMPLTAIALLTCAIFAPMPRHRWMLAAACMLDGGIFAGIVVVKFILPGFQR